MKSLDFDSSTPLYMQLYMRIKDRISAGEWKPGERIPPEAEIAAAYGVSMITARKAMGQLVQEGVLVKKQGKGTFVLDDHPGISGTAAQSLLDQCAQDGSVPGWTVLECQISRGSKAVNKTLRQDPGSCVVYFSRLSLFSGEPVALEYFQFTSDHAYLLEGSVESEDIYRIIHRHHHHEIFAGKRTVHIIFATAAEAQFLNIQQNTPVLEVNCELLDNTNKPIGVLTQVLNAYGYSFRL